MSKLNKIIATALVAAGAFAASGAQAGAQFTVNPNAYITGATVNNFTADQMVGVSSATINFAGQTGSVYNYTGNGYISYGAFQLNSQNLNSGNTFLNTSFGTAIQGYGLYVTFDQTFACNSALGVGVSCTVTGITLNLVADSYADGAATFNASTATSAASVNTTGAGNQVVLGTVTAGVGTAGFNALGGAFQNINTDFNLTAAGAAFFVAPTPFFTMTLNSFNNFTGGIIVTNAAGTSFAINDESGNTGFGYTAVPEPGSLALFGLALAGVAAVSRRKAK